jgi:hypothetical protein
MRGQRGERGRGKGRRAIAQKGGDVIFIAFFIGDHSPLFLFSLYLSSVYFSKSHIASF